MKRLIQIGLFVVIIVLAYFLYASIEEPIAFQKEKTRRYEKVIQKLKDIRIAELSYKDVNGRFTGSFDTLINFVKFDSIPIIKKIGEIPDNLLDSITEAEAVKLGMITRDTIRISVLDTIFGKNYFIDSLKYVPFTRGTAIFRLAAGVVETGSKVTVNVFEAVDTKPFDPNDTLKVGSLTEATNNAGNWE